MSYDSPRPDFVGTDDITVLFYVKIRGLERIINV